MASPDPPMTTPPEPVSIETVMMREMALQAEVARLRDRLALAEQRGQACDREIERLRALLDRSAGNYAADREQEIEWLRAILREHGIEDVPTLQSQ